MVTAVPVVGLTDPVLVIVRFCPAVLTGVVRASVIWVCAAAGTANSRDELRQVVASKRRM